MYENHNDNNIVRIIEIYIDFEIEKIPRPSHYFNIKSEHGLAVPAMKLNTQTDVHIVHIWCVVKEIAKSPEILFHEGLHYNVVSLFYQSLILMIPLGLIKN